LRKLGIGHPNIGDVNCGKGPLKRAMRELCGLERLELHAARLEIEHPDSGERLALEVPLLLLLLLNDLAAPLVAMGAM
jgi:23S rRNA-/tRNA-specific pseudouridylate synthase